MRKKTEREENGSSGDSPVANLTQMYEGEDKEESENNNSFGINKSASENENREITQLQNDNNDHICVEEEFKKLDSLLFPSNILLTDFQVRLKVNLSTMIQLTLLKMKVILKKVVTTRLEFDFQIFSVKSI